MRVKITLCDSPDNKPAVYFFEAPAEDYNLIRKLLAALIMEVSFLTPPAHTIIFTVEKE